MHYSGKPASVAVVARECSLRITNVEFIKFHPPLANRYANIRQIAGIDNRLLAKVCTDNGLVGYGDERTKANWIPPDDSFTSSLIGRNPFDFINNTFFPALGGALYDVMGKHAGVPAYKLMGRKVRDAVSVAAWCPDISAEAFATEVVRAAGQGYNIIKMHTSERYDPIEQTKAAESVAAKNFMIHYDFNGGRGRSLGAIKPLVNEIERNHPIVGWLEDALPKHDVEGWRRLRQQTKIPLVMHRTVLGGLEEAALGMADIYILGDGIPECSIGDSLTRGVAFGKTNVQTIMQLTGGTLSKALALHMSAVLPTMTGHLIALDDQYEEDITIEKIPVTEGFSPVPEEPGLGFEVDEDKVMEFASKMPIEAPRCVSIINLPGGHSMYSAGSPAVTRLTGMEEGVIRGLRTEFWEDDGTSKFEEIFNRAQREGPFFEAEWKEQG